MGERLVTLEVENGVGVLWLDSPPRNATTKAFFEAFARCVEKELIGSSLDGLVISGRGRHFSSGADVDEMTRIASQEGSTRFFERNTAAFERLASLPFPAVAAIGGCCLGSGFELALACDYRIAAPNAVVGLVESEHGLVPGCGGSVRLARLIGRARAAELILEGRSFLAPEALDVGLVDVVAERRELLAVARRLVSAHAVGAC